MAKQISDIISKDDINFMNIHNIAIPTLLETDPDFGSAFDTMYEALEDLELDNLDANYESTPTANHANDILNKLAVF